MQLLSFKKGGWPKKTLILFGAGGMVLFLVGLIFLFHIIGPERREDAGEIVPNLHVSHFPLSSFLVPISSEDQKERFAWIRIVLQLSGGGGEAIINDLSRLRSTVFSCIEHKRPEELISYSARDMLKKEIKKALNKRLEGIKVQGVLFVDLLIL